MKQEYLMGNGAIALGALSAGVGLIAGYPGTPSSEIIETAAKWKPTTSNWELTDGELTSYTAQTLDGGLGATTMTKIHHRSVSVIFTFNWYYRLVRGITANNAYLVWSTKEISPYFEENMFYSDVVIDCSV